MPQLRLRCFPILADCYLAIKVFHVAHRVLLLSQTWYLLSSQAQCHHIATWFLYLYLRRRISRKWFSGTWCLWHLIVQSEGALTRGSLDWGLFGFSQLRSFQKVNKILIQGCILAISKTGCVRAWQLVATTIQSFQHTWVHMEGVLTNSVSLIAFLSCSSDHLFLHAILVILCLPLAHHTNNQLWLGQLRIQLILEHIAWQPLKWFFVWCLFYSFFRVVWARWD